MKALFTLLMLAGVAVAAWWLWPADPAADLRALHAPLTRFERRPAPDLGPRIERWRMVDANGFTARGIWRPAPRSSRDTWTVVMLGGLETGDRAALLVDAAIPANILAVDWPWNGPRKLAGDEVVRQLPAIRAAVLRSPLPLAIGVESAARVVGDSARIALIGASLGVPPTMAALRLTERADAMILVHGAADLQSLLRHAIEPHVEPPWLATPAAALAFRLIRPLEPSYHFAAAARLPVMLIEAEDDDRLPRANVKALERGLPRAEVVTMAGGHVRPARSEQITMLTARAAMWLMAQPRRAGKS